MKAVPMFKLALVGFEGSTRLYPYRDYKFNDLKAGELVKVEGSNKPATFLRYTTPREIDELGYIYPNKKILNVKRKSKKKKTTFNIDEDILHDLKVLSAKTSKPMYHLAEEAIREYLERRK